MKLVHGFPCSGDHSKATVGLHLKGVTEGQFYVLGDQIEGELTITPEQDMQLSRITFELVFIINGTWKSATIQAETLYLPVPERLKKHQPHKFSVQIPYRFPRPSYKGVNLNSYWQLNVFLDYDPAQHHQSFVKRVLKIVPLEERHGTSFEITVKYGKGAYLVKQRELPTGFIDTIPTPAMKTLLWMVPLFISLYLLILVEAIKPSDSHVIMLSLLVAAIAWLIIRLSIFQMTPMELRPLRDGQLRLRILNRGNSQMKKAIVGYRLLECYMTAPKGDEVQKRNTQFQKAFPLAEVARQEEYFYEAVLPWPEIDLPPGGIIKSIGYEWEVFIQVPNPLTGKMYEKSWPIQVGWERLRLAPPTAEELHQEELEVLKLKELEHLPTPESRWLR